MMYTTTCKFCGVPMKRPGLNSIPVVGKPDEDFLAFLAKLQAHIYQKHPEQFMQGAEYVGLLTQFLMLDAVDSQDPEVSKRRDVARKRVHNFTRQFELKDEMIEVALAQLEWLEPEDRKQIAALLRRFRDVMEGRDTAQEPEPSRLVVV